MDDSVRSVWEEYWEAYYDEIGSAQAVRGVATEYPVKRGLVVDYGDLLDVGMSHDRLRHDPDAVLGAGVETFGDFVDGLGLEGAWERDYDTLILHLTNLPDGYKSFDYSNFMEHLNELVQVEVTFTADPEPTSDLMEAAFVCPDGHVTHLHQPGRRRREYDRCPECGKSVYLEERESLFAEILVARGSGEGFSDVPVVIGGRRWKRERMREGDSFVVNGIPRADFTGDSTHGSSYLDALSLEAVDRDLF
jgi:hypothetical protein